MSVAPAPTKCKSGKVSYSSSMDAERTRRDINTRMDATGSTKPRPIRSYECGHCGQWHLTSQPLRRPAYLAREPWGPITPSRRAHWAAMEAERVRANLAHPWPWRKAEAA